MHATYFEEPSLRHYQPFNLFMYFVRDLAYSNYNHNSHTCTCGAKEEPISLRLHNYNAKGDGCKLELSEISKCIEDRSASTSHVFVEGAPGMGKSALAWEMCHKWASGEILQDWSIVILVNLCNKHVREAKLLSDFLYYPDQAMRENICQDLVTSEGKQVLFIVDGLDKLNEQQLTPTDTDLVYQKLVDKKLLRRATIVILKKPHFNRKHQHTDQHIRVSCLAEKNIDDYITSACSGDGDAQLLAAFKSYISSHPYIHNLMHIPAQCVMITDLYCLHWNNGDREFSPNTLTELYTDLVRTLLLRYLSNHREYSQREWVIEDFTDLPDKVKESFLALAHLAANGIQHKTYVFEVPNNFETLGLEEFKEGVSETFGLMQRVDKVYACKESTESYIFLNLTLQEYLAAYYCSQQDSVERLKIVLSSPYPLERFLSSYVCQLYLYPLEYDHKAVFLFTVGLAKLSWDHQALSKILKTSVNLSSTTIFFSAMHLLYETQSPDLIRSTFSSLNHYTQLTDKYGLLNIPRSFSVSTSLDFFVTGYCILHSNRSWQSGYTNNVALALSKGLNMSANQWSSIGHIAVINMAAEDIPLLHPHTQKIIVLTILIREQSKECADVFTKLPTFCPLLKTLTVDIMHTTCLTPLLEVLPFMSSLERVTFRLKRLSYSIDISEICKQLQTCPTNHKIKIGFDKKKFTMLPLTISPNLKCLHLSWLTLTPDLTQCEISNSLTRLKIKSCKIPDDACAALVHFLQSPKCVLEEILLLYYYYYDTCSINKLVQGIGSNCTLKYCALRRQNDSIVQHLVAGKREQKSILSRKVDSTV